MEKYNQTSSGRWDASGSWDAAVQAEIIKAIEWVRELTDRELADVLDTMADDTNAYSTYERKAALHVAATVLRNSW